MSEITLTPLDLSSATELAPTRFRKQILKLGSINYKGRKITFDRPFLRNLVRSFNDGAYDQVPFVLADASNAHNMDPEKFRGEIVGLELTDDGLDAIIEATPDGAKVISSNPRLGVSARIVADLAKSDGRKFPLAIQHVLATMDPRVTGMRPWQAVTDLSNGEAESPVVDLSAHPYDKENTVPRIAKKTVAKAPAKKPQDRRPKKATQSAKPAIDLSALSDEEFQAMINLADGDVVVEDDEDDEDEDEDLDEDESEDEDEESEDEDEDEDEEDDEEDDEDGEEVVPPVKKAAKKVPATVPADVSLSEKRARNIIDLATETLRRERVKTAARAWKVDKREYAAAGVPPFLLDLAAPIMVADEDDLGVFDLSVETKRGKREVKVSTQDLVRKMLDGMKGMVDLSEDLGHQNYVKTDPGVALATAWDNEYGDV